MGRKRKGRPVNGVLLLDKPADMTSNAALQVVKHLFQAQKAGHTGSLDPLATGMLPICFGGATKLSQHLLDSDKTYQVVAKLGVTTATGDAEGDVLETKTVGALDTQKLENVLGQFKGQIDQVPSMYSAIKHQGKPLYELARKGVTIEREPRSITIYDIVLTEHTEDTVSFDVTCSKGTYIRTLVEDIGKKLGCGGHVTALRRVVVGDYQEADMITLDALREISDKKALAGLDACLLPVDSMIQDWPVLSLSAAAVFYITQGQFIIAPKAPETGLVRLYDMSGVFLGIGEAQGNGRVVPKRML